MYSFSGKIKCLDCGKNYRGVMERKVPSYVCSGFTNYGKDFCKRFKIKESHLLELAQSFYEIELQNRGSNSEIKLFKISQSNNIIDLIDKVEVSPKNQTYVITYTNGLKGVSSPTRFSLMSYNDNLTSLKFLQ